MQKAQKCSLKGMNISPGEKRKIKLPRGSRLSRAKRSLYWERKKDLEVQKLIGANIVQSFAGGKADFASDGRGKD